MEFLRLITHYLPWTLLVLCPVTEVVFPISSRSNMLPYHEIVDDVGYPKLGDIPLLNRKIFKGFRVYIKEHPYVASIRRMYAHYCMGAILTKNLIISVAHPIVDVPVNELGTVVGQTYSDRGPMINTVVLIILHENFDKYTLQNDIALLRLYEDLMYRVAVKPIGLSTSKHKLVDARAFVTGWGRCDRTGKELCFDRSSKYFPDEKMDPMLRSISFKIVEPNFYCDGYKQHEVDLKPGMVCLGRAREQDPVSPCLAVPGAPLVVGGHLAGLQSWGFGCSYSYDLPLIYSDLHYFHSWLVHNIVIMAHIKKENLSRIFNVTRASFLSQWLRETRVVKPDGIEIAFKEMTPLMIDSHLVRLNGSVYDIRDFVHDGRYHNEKIEMYKEIKKKSLKIKKTLIYRPEVKSKPFLSNGTYLRYMENAFLFK